MTALPSTAHAQFCSPPIATLQAPRSGPAVFANWLNEHASEAESRHGAVNEILDGGLSVSKFTVAAGLLAEICGSA